MHRNPAIIGIAGPARVGKDTFAQALVNLTGYRLVRFSGAIKEIGQQLFGWNDQYLEGAYKETVDDRFGFSPRTFMLKCGTEFGRQMLGEDIWVKILQRRYGRTALIIPDVRFPNEADWVRKNRGILVHMRRANFTPAVAVNHASEAGIVRDPTLDYVTPEFDTVDDVQVGAVQFYHEIFPDFHLDQE